MNRTKIVLQYILMVVKRNYSKLLFSVNKQNNLIEFIADNNIDKFNSTVNRFNVHFLDKEKNSLLHYACLAGNVTFVQRLLELGLDVNQKNIGGQTPLITTLIVKPPNIYPIIESLTKQKVNLNIKDSHSKDALNYACDSGDIFILDHFFLNGTSC